MSFKVHNAYIFTRYIGIQEIIEILKKEKQILKDKLEYYYQEETKERLLLAYDLYHLTIDKKYFNLFIKDIKREVNCLEDIYFALVSSKEDFIYKTSLFDENESTPSVSLIPHNNTFIMLTYGEVTDIVNSLTDRGLIESFWYSNQVDKPEEISDEDWLEREEVLKDKLLWTAPSDISVSYSLFNPLTFDKTSLGKPLAKYHNDMDRRIKRLVNFIASTEDTGLMKLSAYAKWHKARVKELSDQYKDKLIQIEDEEQFKEEITKLIN